MSQYRITNNSLIGIVDVIISDSLSYKHQNTKNHFRTHNLGKQDVYCKKINSLLQCCLFFIHLVMSCTDLMQ